MDAPLPNHPPTLTATERASLEKGIREINSGAFFTAHETVEHAWTHCHSPLRPFLQAIIHVAVACHHAANRNQVGMERQLAKARRKLAAFLPQRECIQTAELDRRLAAMLRESHQYASGQLPLPSNLIPWAPHTHHVPTDGVPTDG